MPNYHTHKNRNKQESNLQHSAYFSTSIYNTSN